MLCSPRCSVYCLFPSLAGILPARPIAVSLVSLTRPCLSCPLLSASVVSIARRHYARRGAPANARLSTASPPSLCGSLHRRFLFLVIVKTAMPLDQSLISPACRGACQIAHLSDVRRAALWIALLAATLTCSPRGSPDRSSLAPSLAMPLAGTPISFALQRLACLLNAKAMSFDDFAYSADKSPQCRLQKTCLLKGYATPPPIAHFIRLLATPLYGSRIFPPRLPGGSLYLCRPVRRSTDC
jgi:hypothetical protein